MTRRILFIGEEQPLWEEIRGYCAGSESGWAAEFARSGPEALARMEVANFTAVVADVQLADSRGVDLLDEIMRRQPKAFRVVLSDMADMGRTVQCVGRAHHHLLKPCDVSMLLTALSRAVALETWLPSETVQGLIGQMRWVPSPPELYFQVAAEMQSPYASVENVGALIAQDPAIAAKVLQLANSAVFGLQLQVIEPVEAVSYLGLETTKALVLLAHTFNSFEDQRLGGFSVEYLWHHSVFCGRYARRIVQAENGGCEVAEQAAAGGLLHDLGKLLFAANVPERFGQVRTSARGQNRPFSEVESETFGASHAELGACLLGIWGLPKPIIEAVALHHDPLRRVAGGFIPLTAVHAANVLAHEVLHEPAAALESEMDIGYLSALGLEQRIEEWHRQCLIPETEAVA